MRVIFNNSPFKLAGGLPALFAAAIVCIALGATRASADDPKTVVATVGDHKITEQDLDQKTKPQIDELRQRVDALVRDKIFDLKRKTLESMTDEYLLSQAAQQQKLSVDDYVKKEAAGKDGVTDDAAKKFYDDNKQPQWPAYPQVKPEIMV